MLVGIYVEKELANRQLRRSTVKNYRDCVKQLGLWDVEVEDLNLQFIFQKLLEIINPNSRRKNTIALKSVFREFGWAKQLKVGKAQSKMYELHDEKTLREICLRGPYRVQLLLCMYAGLRVSESCAVRPEDINGQILNVTRQRDSSGYITEAKTTGPVIIPEWLGHLVRGMKPRVCTSDAVRNSLTFYSAKYNIHLTPHLLRAWYATTLVNNKVSPNIAQQQLRHKNLQTTLTFYVQVQQKDILNTVDELFTWKEPEA